MIFFDILRYFRTGQEIKSLLFVYTGLVYYQQAQGLFLVYFQG